MRWELNDLLDLFVAKMPFDSTLSVSGKRSVPELGRNSREALFRLFG